MRDTWRPRYNTKDVPLSGMKHLILSKEFAITSIMP
jgi:hypothetical protein